MNALILQYALARSGSTYVEVALREYFGKTRGTVPLSEYFNLHLNYQVREGKIILADWRPANVMEGLSEAQVLGEKAKRLSDLENSESDYFVKILGAQVEKEDLLKLFQRAEVVFSFRENVWEHLLSFLLSFHAGLFYDQGRTPEKKSIAASLKLFQRFCWYQKHYCRYRTFLADAPEISFERFLKHRGTYMRDLGLNQDFDWDRVHYPREENPTGKEDYFANIDELRRWYRDSALGKLKLRDV